MKSFLTNFTKYSFAFHIVLICLIISVKCNSSDEEDLIPVLDNEMQSKVNKITKAYYDSIKKPSSDGGASTSKDSSPKEIFSNLPSDGINIEHGANDDLISSEFFAKKQILKDKLKYNYGSNHKPHSFKVDWEILLKTSCDQIMHLHPLYIQTHKLGLTWFDKEKFFVDGYFRDWIISVVDGLLGGNGGLFETKGDGSGVLPKTTFGDIKYYKFLGRFMALMVLTDSIANVNLDDIIYKQILNQKYDINDLKKVDAIFYNKLQSYRNNPEKHGLFFTDENNKDLEPRGRKRAVDANNIDEYITKRLEYKYVKSIKLQVNLIKKGFYEILKERFFYGWTVKELKLLLCGQDFINIDYWKMGTSVRETKYSCTNVIKWFWEIMETYSQEERSKLFKFVTGNSCLPFYNSNIAIPDFFIISLSETYNLPYAIKKSFTLNLYNYQDKIKLEQDLKQAINPSSIGYRR